VRNAVKACENARKNSFLNYESPALTAELQAHLPMKIDENALAIAVFINGRPFSMCYKSEVCNTSKSDSYIGDCNTVTLKKGEQAKKGESDAPFESGIMTALTPIQVFAEATKRGLKLNFKPPFTLVVNPANRCPDDFADTLSQHKAQLLALLELPFCMVYSDALQETIFFCQDEDTKAALVEAGAQPQSVYTRDELRSLLAHHRPTPLSVDELLQIHRARRMFSGRIA
jgi:hypothetical protein